MRSIALFLSCAAMMVAGCSRDATTPAPAESAKPAPAAAQVTRAHDESSFFRAGSGAHHRYRLELAIDIDKKNCPAPPCTRWRLEG